MEKPPQVQINSAGPVKLDLLRFLKGFANPNRPEIQLDFAWPAKLDLFRFPFLFHNQKHAQL
jgi:hypothetical protein